MGNVISLFNQVKRQAGEPAMDLVQTPTTEVLELMLHAAAHPFEPGAKSIALACFYALSSQLDGFDLDVTPELLKEVKARPAGVVSDLEDEMESKGQL